MTTQIADTLTNTKDIYMTDSALVTLLDFERVLDELDLYAFKNWKDGELIIGPVYEKYFITCTFMWPYKYMPDPRGGERLLGYNCEVQYQKDELEYPIKVTSGDDFEDGTKMAKTKRLPIWLVTITMPKKLMMDIHQGSLELENATVDMEDIEQAYEQGDGDGVDQTAPDSDSEEENVPPQQ